MQRLYEAVIQQHFAENQQMAFLAGPRQVGKTTLSKTLATAHESFYFTWDNQTDRHLIIHGPEAVAEKINLSKLRRQKIIIIFDEIHKYKRWKNFLKGFFDLYKEHSHIIVTGSSRLNVYRRGGDSLMGRYFLYRIHPLSVAECIATTLPTQEIQTSRLIQPATFKHLLEMGGFPEPFMKHNSRFSQRWQSLRTQQLFQEDIRDLSHIHEIAQLEILAEILQQQTGQLIEYSNLSRKVNVSVDTIKRWINTLNSFYYCFTVRPWSKNITRSLLKQPKIYLYDWSLITDPGARAENFVASHLLKAVHYWTDYGFGNFDLYFVRNKEKYEVDFLVTKNKKPWFLVEVKSSHHQGLEKSLYLFKEQLKVPHALQVVFDLEHVARDCFALSQPMIVPVQSFLSQLV